MLLLIGGSGGSPAGAAPTSSTVGINTTTTSAAARTTSATLASRDLGARMQALTVAEAAEVQLRQMAANARWLTQPSRLPLFVFTFFLGACASYMFVMLAAEAARRFDVLARPSERGSHTVPTPRLGGLGIAVGIYLVIGMLYRWTDLRGMDAPWFRALIVGGAWALVGGLLDDVLDLPPKLKFLLQGVAAASAVILGAKVGVVHLPVAGYEAVVLPAWAGRLGAALLIIFWMNAFNFMDGMDGHAATFALVAFLAFAVLPLLHENGVPLIALLALVLAGAQAGFLPFNRPGVAQQRKTFMGDCGSQFIGFALATACIAHAQDAEYEPIGLVAATIILSPFAWDVLFTVGRRAVRGENILKAHRGHLYQRLLICGWSHGQVLVLNCMLWLGALLLAEVYIFAQGLGLHSSQGLALAALAVWLGLHTVLVWSEEARAARNKGGARRVAEASK